MIRYMLAGLASIWCMAAQAQGAKAAFILDEWGVYDATTDRQVDDPDATSGHRTFSRDLHLLERTHVICARLGVHFGLRFHLRDDLPPSNVAVSTDVVHPPMMNMHRVLQTDDGMTRPIPAHVLWYTGWVFSDPHELLAGVWHIIVKQGGVTQIDETFDVRTACGAVA